MNNQTVVGCYQCGKFRKASETSDSTGRIVCQTCSSGETERKKQEAAVRREEARLAKQKEIKETRERIRAEEKRREDELRRKLYTENERRELLDLEKKLRGLSYGK